jgi:hypothetical protein
MQTRKALSGNTQYKTAEPAGLKLDSMLLPLYEQNSVRLYDTDGAGGRGNISRVITLPRHTKYHEKR